MLDVGDSADGYLNGQRVIHGYVMTRQVVGDDADRGELDCV